jgi:hypothetical protein
MKRYPGIQSYDRDRRHLFFGRERETKELFRLTVLQPIVVLFGKSGTGKTSLIQAGVTPMLHERRLHPVFLRINQTDKPIVQQIHALLEQGEYLPYNTPDKLSLWDYCHRFAYSEAGESFTPLYVFDQFEELFTLYADRPEEQKQFIDQLAQVMNGTAPEGHRRSTPPKAHFLISIRSDYLYLLDRLSDQIPAILRTRYELSDLNIDNARQAIEQPALAQGAFDSPVFAYSAAALDNILDELSQEQQNTNTTQTREVGGFQLQLLCQRIEQKIIDAAPQNASDTVQTLFTTSLQQSSHFTTITPDFYGGSEGIRQIIGEFYNSVLQQYPDAETRRRVQQLIEEGLISNGRRIILEENYLKERYHLTQADIELLNRERLCRKEARANQWYYEISHDTLLKPINATYEKRRAEEERQRLAAEKAKAERKAAEAAAQAEKDRQLREAAEQAKRRANIFTTIAVVVALLAVGAGWYALRQQAIAIQKQQEVESANNKFKDKLKEVLELQIGETERKIKVFEEQQETKYAQQKRQQADSLKQELEKLLNNH